MAEGEVQEIPSKNLAQILVLFFIVVNLVTIGAGSFLVYISTMGHKTKVTSESDLDKEMDQFLKSLQNKPIMYTLDTLNTNLDGIPRRLVRVKLSLEMLDGEGFEEIINSGAETRDAIVRILNSTTYQDIESLQGKLQLKNRIIADLNGFLEKGVVRNVYFNDFVVQ